MYLLVLVFSAGYIFILERYGNTRSIFYWFTALIPVYFFLFLIPGYQDGIGTDYTNYFNAYYTSYIDIFYNKGELLIFYLYVFLRDWGLGPQSFFYVLNSTNNCNTRP